MAPSVNGAGRNPEHKPPSREHDQVRSVRLLVALALTLILAGVANTAAQGVDLPPAVGMPKAQVKSQAPHASRWQPPLAVQPIKPATPAVPAAPLPPVAIPRASVITACDAGGCWDSDGARLQRSGPNLMGPRGPCTPHGTLFNCP